MHRIEIVQKCDFRAFAPTETDCESISAKKTNEDGANQDLLTRKMLPIPKLIRIIGTNHRFSSPVNATMTATTDKKGSHQS